MHHEAYLGALAVTAALLALVATRLDRRRPVAPPAAPFPAGPPTPGAGPTAQAGPAATGAVAGEVGRGGRFGAVPLLAIAAGLAMLLPWAWIGALGGASETLLAGLAAAALGVLAGVLLGPGFWAAFGAGSRAGRSARYCSAAWSPASR